MPTLLQGSYTVHIKFKDAPGVGESTPVRKSGILIGRVTHVDFTDDQQVLVTVVHRRQSSACIATRFRFVRTTLLGDAMVQFEPAEDQTLPKDPIQPGDTIQGATARDPLQVIRNLEPRLDDMMKSVTTTSDELGRMAQQLNRVLDNNEGQLDRLLNQTQRTLDTVAESYDQRRPAAG